MYCIFCHIQPLFDYKELQIKDELLLHFTKYLKEQLEQLSISKVNPCVTGLNRESSLEWGR